MASSAVGVSVEYHPQATPPGSVKNDLKKDWSVLWVGASESVPQTMVRSTRTTIRKRHKFTGVRQPDSIKTVNIGDRSLPVSLSTLNTFFEWMAERDRIRKRRSDGKPPPWSQDPTFNSHKFCHVFRIFDRGSQFLLHNVINKGSQEHREICFRVILFKLFNRVSTWNTLQKRLGLLTWASFDVKAYEDVLTLLAQKGPIYTSAYQIPAPSIVSGPGFKNHLVLLQMMMQDDLPRKLLSSKRMQDAYELIKLYPGMGQFLSYQMVLDLNMTPKINFPEDEWAVCGPGSLDCLKRIFGNRVRGIETEAIKYLYETQEKHFTRLHISDPPRMSEGRPGVSFVDIEHSLCECSKYLRCQDRKGNWQACGEPTTSDLPAKWEKGPLETLGNNPSSPIIILSDSDSDSDDEDTYEVSHIVSERQTSSGELEYRIRWTGYARDEDSWMSETDLKDAPEVLKGWRNRKLMEGVVNRRLAKVRRSNYPENKVTPSPTRKLGHARL